MSEKDKVNILLVDDQPAKLLSYEVMLDSLEENLIKVNSGKEALECLLRTEIAVVLVDVCMPDLDGFELAAMIHQHPRLEKTAIILVSGVYMTDFDRLKGYNCGAVDYVPVPVIPEVLRAKVAVFTDLYRKTKELQWLNRELEQRVAERTAALEASTARLRDSEERFRLATEAMRGGVYDWDLASGTVQRSAGLVAILGYGLGEVDPGTDWWRARVHSEDVEACWNVMRSELAGNALAYGLEYRMRHRDGQWVWVWDRGRIVRDATGRTVRVVGHITDIDTQKQAEEALKDADRRKDEFLVTLSHELRTPLTPILGWARLLRSESLDPAASARALESIERNAKTQAQLIEDLLDVSRIITGKLRLELRPAALMPIIDAAIDSIRPAAKAKDIRIHRVVEPSADLIFVDPTRMQQIFWNLLSNAVKFTPQGGQVEVRIARTPSQVEIQVKDTGVGIRADFLPYVFDRFRQADSSITRIHGGLGLGLALVRHLVEMHGGTIQAQSPGEGQGAIFTVRLPALAMHTEENDSERVPTAIECGARIEGPSRLGGLRILVVDDEADTRDLLTLVLERYGAKVTIAKSASEALEMLKQVATDVLVSDIGMPGEDGYDLIRRVRTLAPEQGGQIPAVALTAHARTEDSQRALAAGYQVHVAKPIEPMEFVTVVASVAGWTVKS